MVPPVHELHSYSCPDHRRWRLLGVSFDFAFTVSDNFTWLTKADLLASIRQTENC